MLKRFLTLHILFLGFGFADDNHVSYSSVYSVHAIQVFSVSSRKSIASGFTACGAPQKCRLAKLFPNISVILMYSTPCKLSIKGDNLLSASRLHDHVTSEMDTRTVMIGCTESLLISLSDNDTLARQSPIKPVLVFSSLSLALTHGLFFSRT